MIHNGVIHAYIMTQGRNMISSSDSTINGTLKITIFLVKIGQTVIQASKILEYKGSWLNQEVKSVDYIVCDCSKIYWLGEEEEMKRIVVL